MSEFLSDEFEALPEWSNAPLTPPHAGHHGEAVFTELWAELMAQEPRGWDDGGSNHMLCVVVRWRDDETAQRAASVAATFVKWLGTNCGACFLDQAARTGAQHPGSDRGYVMAWAYENQRKSWRNNGFRAIEHILALEEDFRNGQLATKPELSVDDYEVVEAVVCWLSEPAGIEFVARCKAELKQRILADHVADAVANKDYGRLKFLLRDQAETC